MYRPILFLMIVLLAIGAPAGEPAKIDPLKIGLEEEAEVSLVLLDVLVLDRKGNTVPGLTMEDFLIVIGGKEIPAETLDVNCPLTTETEPGVLRADRQSEPVPISGGRRIVFALDYLHLPQLQRAEVLDQAVAMVQNGTAPGDEIMIVALNGGLRIEQNFTDDMEQVGTALHRMQRDISLWQPSFHHMNEHGWVRGMTTLFDVLGTFPGPKAVVFFSGMADVPLDSQFKTLAAQAAGARCSLYPVDVAGLRPEELVAPPAREELLVDPNEDRRAYNPAKLLSGG